jgi:tRNA pseudouridine55 synthase
MYSAIKSKGEPLYKLARKGITIERAPRAVTVESISLHSYNNPIMKIEINCTKGFYVRSLANDIGESLGCGAHLSNLRRTASGSFSINDSIELNTATKNIVNGKINDILLDPTNYLDNIEKIFLSESESAAIQNGKKIALSSKHISKNTKLACAYNSNKIFIAMLIADDKSKEWKPQKVFSNWLV